MPVVVLLKSGGVACRREGTVEIPYCRGTAVPSSLTQVGVTSPDEALNFQLALAAFLLFPVACVNELLRKEGAEPGVVSPPVPTRRT